jgi:hypothetical protein
MGRPQGLEVTNLWKTKFGGKVIRANGQRKHKVASIDTYNISNPILSKTESGTNLILGLDSTAGYRINDAVMNEGAIGKVVLIQGNNITIEPYQANYAEINTFASTAFFAANTTIARGNNIGDNDLTIGAEAINYIPDVRYNETGVSQEKITITKNDLTQMTWVTFKGRPYGASKLGTSLTSLWMNAEKQNVYANALINKGNSTLSNSIYGQILQEGGLVYSQTASSFTYNQYTDFLSRLRNNAGQSEMELTVFAGAVHRANVASILKEFVLTAGNYSVLADSNKGMDLQIGDILYDSVRIRMKPYYPFDNAGEYFGMSSISNLTLRNKMLSTAMYINEASVKTQTNGLRPAIDLFTQGAEGSKLVNEWNLNGPLDENTGLFKLSASTELPIYSSIIRWEGGFMVNKPNDHAIFTIAS